MDGGNSLRIAVISDIHSNFAALESVFADIGQEQVDEIIALGDNIGYGPDPEKVIQALIAHGVTSVMGNHEYAVINELYFNKLNSDAKKSLQKNLAMLSSRALAYIFQHKPLLIMHGARFVHGCPPKSPTSYLFFPSFNKLKKLFSSFPEKICFYGHTHTINFFEQGMPPEKGLKIAPDSYPIKKEKQYIINPGSVGQPRDGINHDAKYLIWDSDQRIVTFKAIQYDVMKTVNQLRKLEFPSFNAYRLLR